MDQMLGSLLCHGFLERLAFATRLLCTKLQSSPPKSRVAQNDSKRPHSALNELFRVFLRVGPHEPVAKQTFLNLNSRIEAVGLQFKALLCLFELSVLKAFHSFPRVRSDTFLSPMLLVLGLTITPMKGPPSRLCFNVSHSVGPLASFKVEGQNGSRPTLVLSACTIHACLNSMNVAFPSAHGSRAKTTD